MTFRSSDFVTEGHPALTTPSGSLFPFVKPESMDDPLRPINYRIYRDHAYEPSNIEARFLLERVRAVEVERDKETSKLITVLASWYRRSTEDAALVARICDESLDPSGALLGYVREAARGD